MNRTFDYVPRLVEANKNYRVDVLPEKSVFWRHGIVLDQGAEGACVGFGAAAEYGASPFRGKINNQMAFDVYRRAKEIDEWEGVDYDGTSVRAGMLVGREKGWWDEFRWAFNMEELKSALQLGPVVIGINWYETMYYAYKGKVEIGGRIVGGHCLLLTGYSPNYLRRGPTFRWRNSWGPYYGINGNGYISQDKLNFLLFEAGGEAAVPVGRSV